MGLLEAGEDVKRSFALQNTSAGDRQTLSPSILEWGTFLVLSTILTSPMGACLGGMEMEIQALSLPSIPAIED